MKEIKTIKFYGKVLNTWNHMVTKYWGGKEVEIEQPSQYEIAYKEYTTDGELIAKGSEDFSPERRNSNLKMYTVYTWDGEKRQSGGNRWFQAEQTIQINRKDRRAVMEIIRGWYPNAAVIELR